MTEAIVFLTSLTDEFDRLGIAHCLGGSWASTLHGHPRQTLDVDLIVELDGAQIPMLTRTLTGRGWYVSETAMREAVEHRSSFNVIAPESGMKADCFVLGTSAFDRQEFEGRTKRIVDSASGLELPVKSPEDTVLRKLLWYRDTGGTSDRQWSDVLGVLAVRGPSLDRGYLERWADQLGIRDLLDRATSEARS
ncbi:MAG: hypothetical protein HZA61_10475 [Candidatus Eisenbacteria bacterium]|uniref:Nucleotidyltransferase family protein n=1 Tax=Eiseniibacteriota bacterium TaxID=2212470 RepID=A0A933W3G3_UNCEI|nr:hypothetical protein [Candidatus Eisenbacteria bacterium]